MSDDIVKRLNNLDGNEIQWSNVWEIAEDAADEITRLRADLAAVTAERDRMREALSYYAEEDYNGYNGSGACARAAIEGATSKARRGMGPR